MHAKPNEQHAKTWDGSAVAWCGYGKLIEQTAESQCPIKIGFPTTFHIPFDAKRCAPGIHFETTLSFIRTRLADNDATMEEMKAELARLQSLENNCDGADDAQASDQQNIAHVAYHGAKYEGKYADKNEGWHFIKL